MLTSLMTTRRFAPLFWCQLFAALNDNFLKNALVMLILYKIGGSEGATLVTLAGAVFIAPFFILSGIAGQFADKHDKAELAAKLKLVEIPVAAIAALGFLMQSVPLLFLALACFGILSSLFGPIKYGILPTALTTSELPPANALIEGATFIAILAGTITGGLASADGSAAFLIGIVLIGLAVAAYGFARLIPPLGAGAPNLVVDYNPITSTAHLLSDLRADRRIWVGALITSWFWLVGAVALSLIPALVKEAIGGTQGVITLTLVVFTLGIAAGSLLAARASRLRPNLALVPIAALLMGVFCLDIALLARGLTPASAPIGPQEFAVSVTGFRFLIDLAGLAIAGGLFIVPSFSAVQAWAPPDRKARVIAGCNVLQAAFMTAATLAFAALQHQGAGFGVLFLLLGIGNLIAMALILHAWGKEGFRDVAAFIYRTVFRLELKGVENLPKPGIRAIIAPNHVSFLDAGLMYAILPSHASFAIDTGVAGRWWVKPFLKLANTQRIDPTKPMATRQLINAVKADETLVIFPEGRLTTTGGLMKVYDGTAMIADKADALVYPVRIEGLERSPFGYLSKTHTKKAWFPKTSVIFLPPEKLELDPVLRGKLRRQAAGARLQDIMVDSAVKTAKLDQTLFEALTLAHRDRDTGKPAVEDPLGTKLSYKKLITSAQVLGAKLEPLAPEGAAVGVMLPNTAGVAVVFFALQTIGRVPAMLNFTAGANNMMLACKAAKVNVILTSKAFVEKGRLVDVVERLSESARIVYLEDIRAKIGIIDKVRGLLVGSRPQVARAPDDPAAILFTSGSEGTPKGVVLSHRNMLANCAQSLTRVSANGSDKVFNVLPVFHSFGLVAGLLMPLVGGIPVYLYPTPLHYRLIPELVYGSNATILFGTDTFLNGYARVAHPYDFHRVRLILAGAEAVKDRTRQIYMERFGVRILEGYGVTETAPVLAINTPLANKTGTVGRLSPLMEARLEPVPGIDEGGRLFVRGPNVMLGYLRAENPGVLERPAEGWHDTGDIVTIDAQGFIKIQGRAKRFAKIGGEMVSLSAVEAIAADAWPQTISVVVAMPDAKKGERLVLLTTDGKATRDQFAKVARMKGASELMLPSEIMVVDKIPLLGSGKPDFGEALNLVKETLARRPAKPVAVIA